MNRIQKHRGLILLISLFGVLNVSGQVLLEPQLPSQGIVQQIQLWNVMMINNENGPIQANLQMTFQEEAGGSILFKGSTSAISIPKGASQFNSGNLGVIHYEYFGGYGAGSNNGGLLPVGRFVVCYSLIGKEVNINPECLPLTVEPFSPPELIYPENNGVIHTTYPVLNWLAPMPVNMFSNLNYKLVITAVQNGQAPKVAIQRNPLLYVLDQIRQTSYVYPSSYVALEQGKTYAWQIIAQNGTTYSQATDVWSFTVAKDSIAISSDASSYPHLTRGAGAALFYASEKIKFSYENEAGDSIITVKLYTAEGPSGQTLNEVPVHLNRGINFIDLDLGSFKKLLPGNVYVLELINGRKEEWDLRFKYEPQNN
jgi:hypothetical protein